MKYNTLTGKRFGRLIVIGVAKSHYTPNGTRFKQSKCRCDCGATKTVLNSSLERGLTRSCGCLKRELTAKRSTKHGLAPRAKKHPVYTAWLGLRSRCEKPKNKRWEYYGGRGITVCERWQAFENFRDDMLPTWRSGLSIERKDNSKGYSKQNCVWASALTQSRNKRNVAPITFAGQSLFARDWAKKLGGNRDLIYVRLNRGWSIERAVTTPV